MKACAAHRAGRTACSVAITTPTPPNLLASQKVRRLPMSTAHPIASPPAASPRSRRPFKLIGELINSSFARAAKAWQARDAGAYARLAKLQADLGADFLTLNIDGTQS